MAVGDVVSNITSVTATGGILDIRPGAGVEWVIHNLYIDSAAVSVDVQFYDGANVLTWMAAVAGPVILSNLALHANNTIRLRMVNNDGSARLCGYDGVVTK